MTPSTRPPVPRRRSRLSPEAREAMILEGAIDFFAAHGFAGQTRELAIAIGVSEPLIYRYFETKQVLVERVYRAAVLDRWRQDWEMLLRDRSNSMRDRLLAFYGQYLEVIDDAVWVRIVMYASLDGLDLTNRYISDQVRPIISTISQEVALEVGLPEPLDPELVWQLHSTFIYYLVRKYIHKTTVFLDGPELVEMSVNEFMDGIEKRARVSARAAD